MEPSEEVRLHLIDEILKAKEQSSFAFVKFTSTPREYTQGELLYIREVHFVMAVQPGEGRTMSKIAQELQVTQGAASQIAARLEKKGYILRRRNPENYRQIIAVLTEKGEQLYQRHRLYDQMEYQKADELFFSRFSEEELRTFLEYERVFQASLTKATS